MPFERRSIDRAAAFAVGIAISGFPLISSTGAQAHMHHNMGMRQTTPVGVDFGRPWRPREPPSPNPETGRSHCPGRRGRRPAAASKPSCSAGRAGRAGRASIS